MSSLMPYWWQRVALEVLWGFSRALSLSPRIFKYYMLQPLIAGLFILSRYRRRVMLDNLRRSFPERSKGELRRIIRRNYSFLAEMVIRSAYEKISRTICLMVLLP